MAVWTPPSTHWDRHSRAVGAIARDDELRGQLEVNFIGQLAVTASTLPLLRRFGDARGCVFVSSVGGRLAFPFARRLHAPPRRRWKRSADSLRNELAAKGIASAWSSTDSISTPILGQGKAADRRAARPAGCRGLRGAARCVRRGARRTRRARRGSGRGRRGDRAGIGQLEPGGPLPGRRRRPGRDPGPHLDPRPALRRARPPSTATLSRGAAMTRAADTDGHPPRR